MQPSSKRSTSEKKATPDASARRAEVKAHRTEAQASQGKGSAETTKAARDEERASEAKDFPDSRPTPAPSKSAPATSAPGHELTAEQAGARLLELLGTFKVAMLVTREGKSLSARPMSLAELDAKTATAWFISSVDAEHARAMEFSPWVQLVCQSSAVQLSVSGHATLVRDAAKLEALWSEPMRLWFPEGKESADLTLIRVELGDGEFWDHSGARGLKFVFDAAKAWLTGEVVEGDPAAHARANLHQA